MEQGWIMLLLLTIGTQLTLCWAGEPHSYVHGSIIQGIFAGEIRTRRTTYHVDKTEVYFRQPQAFHSVIYSEDDLVIDPFR
ncbi:hypothetical protein NP493_755g01005 [Ridgeia piscesae]|uniref:Uncharacterized protein n=1 Tax=Ridgeia piscesae TaxID=27915 RepID=A0AAD9KNV8_RIDPI|nr:hypothetical protein NP493_755g01005 [Ridgeia piscesae]